ncbi:MAG: hypothetical protein RSB59_00645, partial [Clostridia bacterium]
MKSNKDLNVIMNGIYSKIKTKSFKIANIIVGCLSLCFLIGSFIFEKTNRSIFTAFLVLAILCWTYLIFYGFTRLILSIFAN